MSTDRNAQYMLKNQASNLAVGSNSARGLVIDEDFVVKVWSPTGVFDGGTVTIYIIAADGTAIPIQSFTEAGAMFGKAGQIPQVFKAALSGTSGAANVCATVEN